MRSSESCSNSFGNEPGPAGSVSTYPGETVPSKSMMGCGVEVRDTAIPLFSMITATAQGVATECRHSPKPFRHTILFDSHNFPLKLALLLLIY